MKYTPESESILAIYSKEDKAKTRAKHENERKFYTHTNLRGETIETGQEHEHDVQEWDVLD
jgi:hypothetical protein